MYTIKQASLRSGVGIPLLRAWERRYGVVRPVRTPSGYRLYDEGAIERLRAMRRLVEAGWSPRDAAPRVIEAEADELRALAGSPIESAAPAPPAVESARQVEALVAAARQMDMEALEHRLDEAFATARFELVVENVIFPALVEVGAAWARGELDVGAEHAASAAIERRLGAAFLAASSSSDGPPIVVGLPPNAHHRLAALAFAIAARRAGMRVAYLGADVPVDAWVTAVRETGARAAVIGAVMLRDADAAGAVVAELASRAPDVLRAVGGRYADAVSGPDHLVLPAGVEEAVAMLRGALSAAA